jgi:hypothetical protein
MDTSNEKHGVAHSAIDSFLHLHFTLVTTLGLLEEAAASRKLLVVEKSTRCMVLQQSTFLLAGRAAAQQLELISSHLAARKVSQALNDAAAAGHALRHAIRAQSLCFSYSHCSAPVLPVDAFDVGDFGRRDEEIAKAVRLGAGLSECVCVLFQV